MTAPILLPASALPGLLRRGMEVRWETMSGGVSEPLLVTEFDPAHPVPWWTENGYGGHCYPDVERDEDSLRAARLDLRDPAVRDAVCRWLWARLRPGEPEPLTAPRWCYPWPQASWHPTTPGLRPRWTLGDIGFDARSRYAQRPDDLAPYVFPTLADVPLDSPDRDLLALRCVALAAP